MKKTLLIFLICVALAAPVRAIGFGFTHFTYTDDGSHIGWVALNLTHTNFASEPTAEQVGSTDAAAIATFNSFFTDDSALALTSTADWSEHYASVGGLVVYTTNIGLGSTVAESCVTLETDAAIWTYFGGRISGVLDYVCDYVVLFRDGITPGGAYELYSTGSLLNENPNSVPNNDYTLPSVSEMTTIATGYLRTPEPATSALGLLAAFASVVRRRR